jgi:hypothetical protein
MKKWIWIIILCFGIRNGWTQSYQTLLAVPQFEPKIYIPANGTNPFLQNNYIIIPCVVDWNEDGKKDLLIGCFYHGYVYLFLNSGANSDPVFTTGTPLKADGITISVPYG